MTAEELKQLIQDTVKGKEIALSIKEMIDGQIQSFEKGIKESAPWKADLQKFEVRFAQGLLEYKDLGGGYFMTPQGSIMRTAPHRQGMDPWVQLSPEMKAFCDVAKYLIAPAHSKQRYHTELVAKTLTEGVSTAGGYLVPEEFKAMIYEVVINNSIFMSRAWRIPMRTDALSVPKLSQSFDASKSYFGGISFSWTDEAGTKSETQPTFELLKLIAHKLAGAAFLSYELLEDSAVDFLNYITGLYGRAMQDAYDYYFINGNGAGQPLGILADGAIQVQSRVTANRAKFVDLINMDALLDESFDSASVWLMRKATGMQLRKEVRGANGPLVWVDGYNTGLGGRAVPPYLLGKPVLFTPHCPALGTKGDVILGDLSRYVIGLRKDMVVKTSEHYMFINNLLTFLCESRFDGQPGTSDAFVVLDATTGGEDYIS